MPNLQKMSPERRRHAIEYNRIYLREWKRKNPEKVRQYAERLTETPEAIEREKERRRVSRAKHPDTRRHQIRKPRTSPRLLSAVTREKNRLRCRAWWKANRDRCNAERRGYAASAYPPFGELSKKSLMQNDMYAAAVHALPKGLPVAVRDDVISDIVMAVLEGRLTLGEIAHQAKRFLRDHYSNFQDRAFVSLDEIKPGTKTTWLDCLAAS